MSLFFIIIALACGFSLGYLFGIGNPSKSLPPKGTILKVEAAFDNVFLTKYNGRVRCFMANDRYLTKGVYEIIIVEDRIEGKRKKLRQTD